MSVSSLLNQIHRGRQHRNQGFSMGLPKYESIVDGLCRETYYLIFSDSGSGKTSLALYSYIYRPLMENLDNEDFKIVYYSLEMNEEALLGKLLSIYIFETYGVELSIKQLFSRKKNYILPDEHYELVEKSIDWLNRISEMIVIYDKQLNSKVLYHTLKTELEKDGKFVDDGTRHKYIPNNEDRTTLVVIDHMALITPIEGRTLKEEIDLCSKYLVTLKNKCYITPLVIMQANRNAGGMDRRKEGMLSFTINDVKDSGGPKQKL